MKDSKCLLLILIVVFVTGCAAPYHTTVVDQLDFSKDVSSLELTGFNGSVNWNAIPAWETPYIIVEKRVAGTSESAIKAYARTIDTNIIESLDSLEVRTTQRDRPHGVKGVSISYHVYASPSNIQSFMASTSNGSIWIEDFKGEVDLQTSNGSVTFDNGWGKAKVHTSNGRIELNRVTLTGNSSLRTSNGRIAGDVDLIPGNDYTFETSNGRIDMAISRYTEGRFDLKTSNGQIDVSLTGNKVRDSSPVRIVVGDPKTTVLIRTSNGSIYLTESWNW